MGILILMPGLARGQLLCADIFKHQFSSLILNDQDYVAYSKEFAEGRNRDHRVPKFKGLDDSSESVLRPAEQAAIYFYTYNPNFVQMNSVLRRGLPENQIAPYISAAIKLAISGLSKLPDYKGAVYRGGVRNPIFYDEVLEKYKAGSIVSEKTFLSTSKGSCWRCDFKHQPLVNFYITSKTGKEIDDISVNPKEREVLFLPNTLFRVDRVETINGVKIWMTEI